jgi:serine/threonine protein kinase
MSNRPPLAVRKASSDPNTARPGIGLTLAKHSSSGTRYSSEHAATVAPDGLRAGEVLDTEGIDGKPIFIIRNAAGIPVGVRKIAHENDRLKGHFTATQNEAKMYAHFTSFPHWRDHILPFRRADVQDDIVVIDFDWVDGEDVEKYLASHPEDTIPTVRQIIMQLRWLVQHGYIHGDIKLDNFYRAADGRILIFDFGRSARAAYASIMTDATAVSRLVRPHNPELADWLLHLAVEEQSHIGPFKDKLAEIYLKTVSRLVPKRNSSNSKRSNSSKYSSNSRKSRKASSSNRSRKTKRNPH